MVRICVLIFQLLFLAPLFAADRHWAFQPAKRPAVPKVQSSAWPNQPIDHFVLARLEARG